VKLGELAVQRVIPIWHEVRGPDDTIPETTLESANALMRGSLSEEEALEQHGTHWTSLDDIAFEHEDQQVAVAVGYGALQVLACAIRDEIFDPDGQHLTMTDRDVDPDELDASFMASGAYAGGPVWDPLSDSEKRLRFWDWWLNEAVPNAASA
jgi:hypothetical protein